MEKMAGYVLVASGVSGVKCEIIVVDLRVVLFDLRVRLCC